MHSLDAIKNACAHAAEKAEQGAEWRAEYCLIVDPLTVTELVRRLEQQEKDFSAEELRALGKLVRDLSGYIKMTTGDKPNSVRDDLLLQARQVLRVTGI